MNANDKAIEVTAKSVDEAVEQALSQLGLRRDQVEIEIVKQGSRGLLGLLSEPAVVRVKAAVAPARVEAPKAPARVEAPETLAPVVPSQVPSQAPGDEAADLEQVGEIGIEVVQRLLYCLGINGSVSQEEMPPSSQGDRDSVYLNIEGDGLGVLIGRRGETLRDLQYVASLVTSRRVQRWPNFVIDVEHYRARREKSLVELAHRMAERVRSTAQPMPLELMPPNERRIIHLALRDDPGVYTESTGQDEGRKVVILPKK